MRRMLLGLILFSYGVPAQVKPGWKAMVGTWEGESICTVPDSPCHDEHVLYRVKPDKDDPEKLVLEAFKVLDKKPHYMGTLECRYADNVLTCTGNTAKRDVWSFSVAGDAMDGTLTIGEAKTLYRKISLKKK